MRIFASRKIGIALGSLRCPFLLGPFGSSLPVHRCGETFGYLCREILLECQIFYMAESASGQDVVYPAF